MVLVIAVYKQQKEAELKFNERKAELIKENLDLKDSNKGLSEIINQKKEVMAILEEKQELVEKRIESLAKEKEVLHGRLRSWVTFK